MDYVFRFIVTYMHIIIMIILCRYYTFSPVEQIKNCISSECMRIAMLFTFRCFILSSIFATNKSKK